MRLETVPLRRLIRVLGVCALAAACAVVDAAPTEIKMPTSQGFVAFTVEGQWPVLVIQPRYPVASAAFRIPHPADAGSPDSSNIVIAFYDPHTAEGRSAFATPPKQYGVTAPVVESRGAWTIYRQIGQQGDTPYTIVDAKRTTVAGVSVSVRMVWPRRADYPADFDASMDHVLQGVLQSVHAGVRSTRH